MKKITLFLFTVIAIIAASCGNKKKNVDVKNSQIPILPFVRNQVANVDTSLYTIIHLTFIDSNKIDTQYIPREEFKNLASDFLSLPDITSQEFAGRFYESVEFDTMLQRVNIVSLPVDATKEMIQQQHLVITPNLAGGESDIKSIYVDYLQNTKDSSVQKKMLWQADKSFQVTTIKQLPGKPEIISTTKTIWNEPFDQ